MEIATLITILAGQQYGGNQSPTLNKGLDLKSRLDNLINALFDEECIESKFSLHPNVIKFIELWSAYIVSDKEDTNQYDIVKKAFINAFGEKVFQDWLFYSYYFVRSQTMQQRNWVDNNLREIGY